MVETKNLAFNHPYHNGVSPTLDFRYKKTVFYQISIGVSEPASTVPHLPANQL